MLKGEKMDNEGEQILRNIQSEVMSIRTKMNDATGFSIIVIWVLLGLILWRAW